MYCMCFTCKKLLVLSFVIVCCGSVTVYPHSTDNICVRVPVCACLWQVQLSFNTDTLC